MISSTQVLVKEVKRKVSGLNNIYFLVDVTEFLPLKDEKGNPITREWLNLYFSPSPDSVDILQFINKQVIIDMNFYPIRKVSGDKVFMDISCNIASFKEV